MSDDPTEPTETMTIPEARQQLADDKEAATEAVAHLEELQQRLSDGDRTVTQDQLRDARSAVEYHRLQVEGSERNLTRVAQRVVDETAAEIEEQALADLRENRGDVEGQREKVNEARADYKEEIAEENKRVSRWHRKLRQARPDNLPEEVDTEAFARAGKNIGRFEVEYEPFPFEEAETVYVSSSGGSRERAGRVTASEELRQQVNSRLHDAFTDDS